MEALSGIKMEQIKIEQFKTQLSLFLIIIVPNSSYKLAAAHNIIIHQ